jgi:hypothetical protein
MNKMNTVDGPIKKHACVEENLNNNLILGVWILY